MSYKEFEEAYESRGERALVPGVLRGYRYWYLDLEAVSLRSIHIMSSRTARNFIFGDYMSERFSWEPGVMAAECIDWREIRREEEVEFSFAGGTTKIASGLLSMVRHERFYTHPGIPSPSRYCMSHCGFYGRYRDDFNLDKNMDGINWDALTRAPVVFGSFKAFGRVILGESGFRAEKVEVEALCIPAWKPRRPSPFSGIDSAVLQGVGLVAERYGVPYLKYLELMEKFPPQDVAELIGPPGPDIRASYTSLPPWW